MIEKLVAIKLMSLCRAHGLNGCACCLGDQLPTFSREWAESVWEQLGKGVTPDDAPDSGPLMSAEEFFRLCGFSDYVDIDYNGKAKILLDLGQPIPRAMHSTVDCLYDGGVIEHIPDCLQALCNNALLLKKGGLLLEGVPAACFAESYYNIDPLLLRDFYANNGFEMIECSLHHSTPWYYPALSGYLHPNPPAPPSRGWVKRSRKCFGPWRSAWVPEP